MDGPVLLYDNEFVDIKKEGDQSTQLVEIEFTGMKF